MYPHPARFGSTVKFVGGLRAPRQLKEDTVYLFDFQSKLKRLNPLLCVHVEKANRIAPGVFVTGIYLRQPKRHASAAKTNTNYASLEQREILQSAAEGHKDVFVHGVSTNYVPEYDIFDLDREKLLMPGYRTILLALVKKGLCPLDRARRVFNCSSLGDTDWDKITLVQRMSWAKGNRPERKFK